MTLREFRVFWRRDVMEAGTSFMPLYPPVHLHLTRKQKKKPVLVDMV
jgi:hypothetical protein